jgi:hypothetical protein
MDPGPSRDDAGLLNMGWPGAILVGVTPNGIEYQPFL